MLCVVLRGMAHEDWRAVEGQQADIPTSDVPDSVLHCTPQTNE